MERKFKGLDLADGIGLLLLVVLIGGFASLKLRVDAMERVDARLVEAVGGLPATVDEFGTDTLVADVAYAERVTIGDPAEYSGHGEVPPCEPKMEACTRCTGVSPTHACIEIPITPWSDIGFHAGFSMASPPIKTSLEFVPTPSERETLNRAFTIVH